MHVVYFVNSHGRCTDCTISRTYTFQIEKIKKIKNYFSRKYKLILWNLTGSIYGVLECVHLSLSFHLVAPLPAAN